MKFDSIKKALQNVTATTAKKTGEQVQITKLALDKTKLEKELETTYAKIGRRCCELQGGEVPADEVLAAGIGDVKDLLAQLGTLENEIKLHKLERDSAQYQLRFDEDEDDKEIEVEIYVEKNPKGETAEEAPTEESEAPKEDPAEEAAPAEEETPAEESDKAE